MGIFDFLKKKKDSSDSLITRFDVKSSAHEAVKEEIGEQKKAGIELESVKKSRGNIGKLENQTQVFCPCCEALLKDIPKKKKKCPACGNYIYVRTKQNLFPSVLLREEDALAVDGFEKLKAYGIAQQDFTREKNRLLKEKNTEVSSIDVCLKLYDKVFLRTTDLHILKMIHFERALFLYYTNRDFFIDLQMSLKMELMAYQKEGNKKVSIFAGGDSCPECKKLSGRVYTIDEALREKPIPCKACSFRLRDGRIGWCRCMYMPHK